MVSGKLMILALRMARLKTCEFVGPTTGFKVGFFESVPGARLATSARGFEHSIDTLGSLR